MTRSRWTRSLAAVLAAGALAGGAAGCTDKGGDAKPTAGPSATSVKTGPIAHFTGSGKATTKAFEVAANWEVRWTSAVPTGFAIELLGPDGASRGRVVEKQKRKSGTTFVSEAGTFTLRVVARGAWTIDVVSRPPGS